MHLVKREKINCSYYPEAIVEKVIEKEFEKNNLTFRRRGIATDLMDELLIDLDFEKVDYVYEPGQFAIRGGIIDVFSFNYEMPYRVELFGDEIESIREFDPVNQLSVTTSLGLKLSQTSTIYLYLKTEFPFWSIYPRTPRYGLKT